MSRAPAFLDNRFGRYPRTTAEAFGLSPAEAQAIYHYPAPLARRIVTGLGNACLVLALCCGALALAGCGDVASYAAAQADLQDARAQARAEWHAQARAYAQQGARP